MYGIVRFSFVGVKLRGYDWFIFLAVLCLIVLWACLFEAVWSDTVDAVGPGLLSDGRGDC